MKKFQPTHHIKFLAVMLLSILLVMGLCGCIYTIHLKPTAEKGSVKEEMLTYLNKKYEDGTLSDNFMAFVFKKAFELRFEEIAYGIYGKCVVCSLPTSEMLPDSVNMDTKLKDYLSSSASLLQATLFTAASSDTKETDIQKLSGNHRLKNPRL